MQIIGLFVIFIKTPVTLSRALSIKKLSIFLHSSVVNKGFDYRRINSV